MWADWRKCFAVALVSVLMNACGNPLVQPTAPSQAPSRPANAQEFVTLDGVKFPAPGALGPPFIPLDNPQSVDENGFPRMEDPKVQLGKLLFFDARLSGDNSVSCGTCHEPDQGWGLNSSISRGYPGTMHWRNSHTVINSAYQWKLFWEGSSLALEPQAKSANTGLSGNGKTDMMEERLRQVPEYVERFKQVFGTEVPLLEDAWRAIAAFQRVLVQPDTPFDNYVKGDKTALDEAQIRGLELFNGKAGCVQCHNGALFSDQKYYNLGVPQQEDFLQDPLLQITHRWQYYQKGSDEDVYRQGKMDLGLYFVTHRKEDMGKFRVQPLRYLTYTPPYMHNGVFDDLMEVVDFYNDGGGEDLVLKYFGIPTKSKLLKKLNLTEEEKEDLVAFLDSLSGEEIKMDIPKIPDPMAVVYQGETYVGLPIPVVSSNLEERQNQDAAGVVWSLVNGPAGTTIDPKTGRVTWPNAQPTEAAGKEAVITITILATRPGGVTEDQTLQLTVLRQSPRTASGGMQ
ncbi:MAG: cytochrome-c peroxidase [Acidobacteria bacterium]|nr:cytochrome-c peroxidase [Acidobacteriota bacterium]